MTRRKSKPPDQTGMIEDRVRSLEGMLQGMGVVTIVFSPEGQILRATSSGTTVEHLRAAQRALQLVAMQMGDQVVGMLQPRSEPPPEDETEVAAPDSEEGAA